ncbi:hypothetical protein HID58_047354, partial [Brassica napus]
WNKEKDRRLHKASVYEAVCACIHDRINTDHMSSHFFHPITLKANQLHKLKRMNFMFYFLLALTTVLAVTASPGQPVLDINGDIISDGSYYVIPLNYGTKGGGLTLSPRENFRGQQGHSRKILKLENMYILSE